MSNGQYVPRALFLDLEATVIDCIRTGRFRKLHHPNNMLNYIEDGANCWARGRYNTGKQIIGNLNSFFDTIIHLFFVSLFAGLVPFITFLILVKRPK